MAQKQNITALNIKANFTSLNFGSIDFKGYSTDSLLDAPETDITENRVGVDGVMVTGLIASLSEVSFTFEASSPAYSSFQNGLAISQATLTIPVGLLLVTYPSQSKKALIKGASLKRMPLLLSADKLLKPAKITFEFSSLNDLAILPM